MSNAAKLAEILKRLGDAHYQAADELLALGSEQVAGSAPSPATDDFPPMDSDLPPRRPAPATDEGSEAMCPKHRKPYKDGQYGPFCTAQSDDPAWANKRGYCNITPKNAHVWLRHQASAA